MASKVPKFGAWEEGNENYTVYFDKARDSKHTGKKINPNDPEENPDMFRQIKDSAQTRPQTQTRGADKRRTQAKVPNFGAWENGDSNGYTQTFEAVRRDKLGGSAAAATATENEPQMNRDMSPYPGPSVHAPAQARSQPQAAQPQIRTQADKQRTQATVPHFGAWDNGDPSGYTQTFEKVRKYRLGEPTAAENGPQMNRDMPPQSGPSVHAQPQSQPRPASREGRSKAKVPQFGEWDSEGGGGYTRVFDNLHKKHPYSTGPQPNRDVGPKTQEGNAKTPEFGDWEGGEAVQYTEYFENPQRKKNLGPGQNLTEPQMNRDVSQGPTVTRQEGHGKPSSQVTPVHPNANVQPRLPAIRGNPPTTIPNFGGWNTDPTQAEGYTGEFTRAREERQTPQHHTVPRPYHQPHRNNKQTQQPSCCTIL